MSYCRSRPFHAPIASLPAIGSRRFCSCCGPAQFLCWCCCSYCFLRSRPEFLTANNLSILTKHVAITALLAIGMTFVMLTGGIDLSVGSIAGLGGMVAGYLLTQGFRSAARSHYPPVAIVILITICACMVVGVLNGWLVAKAGVAPFIATLGTLYIARGAALLISNGKTFPESWGRGGARQHGISGIRSELHSAYSHARSG